jgi:hypothetical protein
MRLTVTGPLNDFINDHYRRLFTVTGYDFLVPRTSAAAAFYVAQNFQQAPGLADSEPALIRVKVATQATVARIVLRDVRQPDRVLGQWQAGNSRATLSVINTAGQTAGPAQPAPWPLQVDGLRELCLYHDQPLPRDQPDLELLFFDAAGRLLFEACYDAPVSAGAPPAGG